MARLVALGDSLTQGFQSGAIFHTEWSYPAMIARSLGLNLPLEFRFPRFPGSGLPLNIEAMLRRMAASLGPDIGAGEWFLHFPQLLNQFVDEVEDLYERGAGASPAAIVAGGGEGFGKRAAGPRHYQSQSSLPAERPEVERHWDSRG